MDRIDASLPNIRSPGHVVRLSSRWPMTRFFVTTTPSLYRVLPAEVKVVEVVGSQPLSQAFQPMSLPTEARTAAEGVAAPAEAGSWLPSELTPKVCELKPPAWAPTTLR